MLNSNKEEEEKQPKEQSKSKCKWGYILTQVIDNGPGFEVDEIKSFLSVTKLTVFN